MRPPLKTRVQRRLQELGITAAEATRRGKLSRTLIYDILDGRKENVRADNAAKLAQALDADVDFLSGTQAEPRRMDGYRRSLDGARDIRMVRVVGDVAAGVWNESTAFGVYDPDLPSEFDAYPPVPVVPDPRYKGLAQFAVRVVGPSINRVIPDGYFAVCVPYWDARSAIQDGDLVVIERIRGGLHESTIKRVRRDKGGWVLHPESTDKRYQEPVALASDLEHERDFPDVTIEIKGLVIWKGAPV